MIDKDGDKCLICYGCRNQFKVKDLKQAGSRARCRTCFNKVKKPKKAVV